MVRFRRVVGLCASMFAMGCGAASPPDATTIASGVTATRVVAGDGWSFSLPVAFIERRPASFDAWFDAEDGSALITVDVWRRNETELGDVEATAASVIEDYAQDDDVTCETVSEAPTSGLSSRRVRCTGLDIMSPSESGEPLDRLDALVVTRRNWTYIVECFDREGRCGAILDSVRVGAAIEPAGRTTLGDLQFSIAYLPSFPFDSGLPGANETRLAVSADAPGRGATRPLVTIVQFTDLECPFCKRVEPTLTALRSAYPDTLRIVTRHNPLPFHQNAPLAAQALEEARDQGGDEAFFNMLDAVFRAAPGWGRAELLAIATEVGLDADAMAVAFDDGRHLPRIETDKALAARVGANGTPNFFINGRQLTGAQPIEAFQRIIDEELALARRALEAGVPRERLYDAALANALEEAPPRPEAPPSRTPLPVDPMLVYDVPAEGFPTRGRADALVTVVMFTDFECPFCARAHPTMSALLAEYGNAIRLVVRNNPLPFHSHAALAAEAALEAYAQRGNDGYFAFVDLLFANQRTLARAYLEDFAMRVGLDRRRFVNALETHVHAPAITLDQTLARELGAGGTPSFFINGRLVKGAQPIDAFRTVIDRELAEARARVAAGTPRRRLYASIIADGLDSAPAARYAEGEAASAFFHPRFASRAPRRGAPDAPILIELFTDLQCPFCARIRPTLDRVLREYAGRVRLEVRNHPLPFHPEAMLAAEVGREIFEQLGDDAFFTYYEAVFDAQADLSRERIFAIARGVRGVDVPRLERAIAAGSHRALIEAEIAALRAVQMEIGTPSVLIDGQLVRGAVPFAEFARVIDAQLAARGVRTGPTPP